ncbi:MAG: hypothetical protein Ta2A_03580 [Treponemataceae bacterium]|nr:MAG: hypothetical protein Ta2A_03580 [Treponemataceae bacterium]
MASDSGLLQAYEFLKVGNTVHAKQLVEEAVARDLDNAEAIFALSCVNFWLKYGGTLSGSGDSDGNSRTEESSSAYEKGESLIMHWKQFVLFVNRAVQTFDDALYAVKSGVFQAALDFYRTALAERNIADKADVYRKIALCCKKLGDYESALSALSEANVIVPNSALYLAETADCYALSGDDRTAKVLFREAFFIGAGKIELIFLESELIGCLIDRVAGKGFAGDELAEWIPVFGVLFGVFNVKREIRAHEAGRLRQTVYALENDLKDPACNRMVIVPRLINSYFWMIDYFTSAGGESRSKIDEVLLKIKLLDMSVFEQYTGMRQP